MPLIESLLARLRPRGVTRVVYAGERRAMVEGKTAAELYAEQPHLRTVVDFLAEVLPAPFRHGQGARHGGRAPDAARRPEP